MEKSRKQSKTAWKDLSFINQETEIFKDIFTTDIRRSKANSNLEFTWSIANITNETMCIHYKYAEP